MRDLVGMMKRGRENEGSEARFEVEGGITVYLDEQKA